MMTYERLAKIAVRDGYFLRMDVVGNLKNTCKCGHKFEPREWFFGRTISERTNKHREQISVNEYLCQTCKLMGRMKHYLPNAV